MNKKFLSVFAILSALTVGLAAVGCSEGGTSGSQDVNDGKHVRDEASMGGEGVLDDGGRIIYSEPILKATGVRYNPEDEHRIYLGKDTDKYEIEGAANVVHSWFSNTFYRLQCNNGNLIFPLVFDDDVDLSRVGMRLNLINNRCYTEISISFDGRNNWIPIGYADEEYKGIRGDYTQHLEKLYNWETEEDVVVSSDSNIYECYYLLGDYALMAANYGVPLYVRCSRNETDYWGGLPSKDGTDVISFISYYDSLEVVYEYL